MPDLHTSLHTDMLKSFRARQSLPVRLFRAVRRELSVHPTYGSQWGDPDTVPPLVFVRDRWVLPYVRPESTALEIGPGGGRWTRYLLGFGRLYAVDYHSELLTELKKNFDRPDIVFIHNTGTDFPGVPDRSIDYLFSFGTFVHLDLSIIEAYLHNMKRILKSEGNAVIHYADKTKIMARQNESFADNTPSEMRHAVSQAGFSVLEEDLTTLWHSSLIRFTH